MPVPTPRPPRWMVALACLATMASTPVAPPERVRLVLRDDSRLWLEGDSNVRRWSCLAGELIPEFTLHRDLPTDPPIRVEEATVRVPVGRIECGSGRMNRDLRAALRAVEHPEITFDVTDARFGSAGVRGRVDVTATGRLTVAGVSRALELQVAGTDTGDGALRLRGGVAIQMTDFAIAPPTALLGLVRAKDEVTIRFDLIADYETFEETVAR